MRDPDPLNLVTGDSQEAVGAEVTKRLPAEDLIRSRTSGQGRPSSRDPPMLTLETTPAEETNSSIVVNLATLQTS